MTKDSEHQTFVAAHLALKAGEVSKALQLSVDWIARCPDDLNAYLMAAAASNRLKQFDSAHGFSTQALAIDPDNSYALVHRGNAYKGRKELNLAFEDGKRAVELYPNNLDAHRLRDSAAMTLFKSLKTEDDFEKSIEMDPTCGAAYVYRSYARQHKYRYSDAIDDCNKAISLNSCLFWARIYRAFANLAMNNIGAADEDYRALYRESVDKPGASWEMSYVLYLKSSLLRKNLYFDDALSAINRALKLQPEWVSASINRAELLCSLSRLDEAMSVLEHVVQAELTPTDRAYAFSNRARVHLRREKFDEALQDIGIAMDAEPGTPDIIGTYGLILVRAGRLTEAEPALTEAISIDPYCREAYWFRHELYEKMGCQSKSVSDKKIAQDYGYKPYI